MAPPEDSPTPAKPRQHRRACYAYPVDIPLFTSLVQDIDGGASHSIRPRTTYRKAQRCPPRQEQSPHKVYRCGRHHRQTRKNGHELRNSGQGHTLGLLRGEMLESDIGSTQRFWDSTSNNCRTRPLDIGVDTPTNPTCGVSVSHGHHSRL